MNQSHHAAMGFPRIRKLLFISLTAAVVFGGVTACSEEGQVADPFNMGSDSFGWVRPDRSVGDIHNAVLSRYFKGRAPLSGAAELTRADLYADFRAAVLEQVALDTQNDAAAIQEVETIFDGPAFVEIQRRFDQAEQLVRVGHPDPTSVASMLEGWAIESTDAATLGEMFSYALLSGSIPSARLGASTTEAVEVFRDVFQNSAEYWNGRYGLSKKAPTSEVIVADAVGALGGLAFGAIGSIIGGAAYSIFWEETTPEPQPGGCGSCH